MFTTALDKVLLEMHLMATMLAFLHTDRQV